MFSYIHKSYNYVCIMHVKIVYIPCKKYKLLYMRKGKRLNCYFNSFYYGFSEKF